MALLWWRVLLFSFVFLSKNVSVFYSFYRVLFSFFFSYVNELQGGNSSHMPIAMKVLEESGGQLRPPPPNSTP